MGKRKLAMYGDKAMKKTIVYVSNVVRIERPVIGVTYLNKNTYGIKNLFDASKGKGEYIVELYSFLEEARNCESISDLIATYASHNKIKNTDDKSMTMIDFLRKEYGVEADHFIHLHCKRGGKGTFVLHGFQYRNVFEIVFLDPKHQLHPS
jgi:hypothetical protein